MNFERITADPNQMGGSPCIRGLPIPVARVLELMGDGLSRGEVLDAMPHLVAEDIDEVLRYAAATVREGGLPLNGDCRVSVEASWSTEIQRRLEEIDAGAVTFESWATARKHIMGG